MEKEDLLKILEKNVIKIRTKKGWSQSELAWNCCKDRRSIEIHENGIFKATRYFIKLVPISIEQMRLL